MPDITMCSGIGCENRGTCYRAMATPETYQSYFFAPPLIENTDGEGVKCDHYLPFREEKTDSNRVETDQETKK